MSSPGSSSALTLECRSGGPLPGPRVIMPDPAPDTPSTCAVLFGMTTRSGEADATTMFMLPGFAAVTLNRPVSSLVVARCSQIVKGRNLVHQRAKWRLDQLPPGVTAPDHLIWIDSDIVLEPRTLLALAECVHFCEAHPGTAAGIAYAREPDHDSGGQPPAAMGGTGEDPVYDDSGQYQRVAVLGFGATVIPMDLDYVFHADNIGEDVYYARDHPDLTWWVHRGAMARHRKYLDLAITDGVEIVEDE